MAYLEFEKPIAELQEKIDELTRVSTQGEFELTEEIEKLSIKNQLVTKKIFSKLTPWEVSQVARHPMRPYTLDYIDRIVTDFQQLHGDRMYSDDPAIVAGVGRIDGQRVALIGQQKGRDTKERMRRNFGMPRPEGYRKAQRIMRLAERFKLPLVTLIDTPGAYPGVGAEERGQSQAIAQSLEVMVGLKTPIISVVIGEGGSGGALAIGVCDYLIMLEYSTYSVISPEGCASILWKSADKAAEAAQAMGITTKTLTEQELVDEVIEEPLGGAHRNHDDTAKSLKSALIKKLTELKGKDPEQLLHDRYQRLMNFGQFAQG